MDYKMDMILYNQWLQILDHLNMGAMLIGSERQIIGCNTIARTLLGLTTDEIMGGDCQEIFCGIPCFSTCPFTKKIFGNQEEDSKKIRDMDIEYMDESHQRHRLTRVGAPLLDTRGRIRGCVTVLQNHDPYSALINRIHYEEQSLKIILDSLNMGIFTVNRSGLITFFNHACEKMTGFSRMKLLGRLCRTIFGKNPDHQEGVLKKTLISGKTGSGVATTLLNAEGENIPVLADYIPLRNDQGKTIGCLAALQDMTIAQKLDQVVSRQYRFHHMIGKSPEMQKIFEMIRVVAKTDSTLLIEGATGTGKDLLAKIIHSESLREGRPFIKINCAAIPENLLESEFFGYVKGAFTGAEKNKPGRFNDAHRGTIFLDEIGDLPLALQAKLLRVLEEKEFYPLGGRKTQKVDVRILSATNRRLEHLVKERSFREDLFYRLNVLRIELPPLMERQGDLPLLIRHLLRKQAAAMKKTLPDISKEAMEQLLNYTYPGNIRELENILEHALIICQSDTIHPVHLPPFIFRQPRSPVHKPTFENKNNNNPEGIKILKTLERFDWHRSRTAAHLNMDRSTLWRKMKRYGISTQRPN